MGLLTGLLGSAFSQDPNTTFGERMAMNYTPGMYQAQQQRAMQEATKQALGPMGFPEGVQEGMARNPDLLKQFGGAYGPGESDIQLVPTPGGGSVVMQKRRMPGGQWEMHPINIGAAPPPPGTTTDPTRATQPQATPQPQMRRQLAPSPQQQPQLPPMQPPQQPQEPQMGPSEPGTPAPQLPQLPGGAGQAPIPPGPLPSGVSQQQAQQAKPQSNPWASYKPPAGVIPGTPGDLQEKIQFGKAHGASQDQLLDALPGYWKDTVKALLNSEQDTKDLATRGGAPGSEADRTAMIHYAHMINPDWDETRSNAMNKYKNSYFSTGTQGQVGYQKQAYGAALHHINTTLDKAIDLDPSDSNIAPLGNLQNWIRGLGGEQAAKRKGWSADVSVLGPEIDKYVSGRAATESGGKQQLENWPVNGTPREIADAAEGYLNQMRGKIKEMEDERDSYFKDNPEKAKTDYPIELEAHKAEVRQIEAKIAKLRASGNAQTSASTMLATGPVGIKNTGAASPTATGEGPWQPPKGWSYEQGK